MSSIRFVIRLGYAPVLFVGFLWAAVGLTEWNVQPWALWLLLAWRWSSLSQQSDWPPMSRSGIARTETEDGMSPMRSSTRFRSLFRFWLCR